MGLVANYGSDSDSEDSRDSEPTQVADSTESIQTAETQHTQRVISTLNDGTTGLLSKLPAPKAKKTVQYKLSVNTDLLKKRLGDESPPRKVAKVAKSGVSLKDLLPPPKYQDQTLGGGASGSGGAMLDLGGGTSASGASFGAVPGSSTQPVAAAVPRNTYGNMSSVYGSAQTQAQPANYIMEHQITQPQAGSSSSLGAAGSRGGPAGPRGLPPSFFDSGASPAGAEGPGAQHPPAAAALPAAAGPSRPPPSQEQLLSQAMQEEALRMNRNSKRGQNPFKKMEMPQMMEVSADSLTQLHRPTEVLSETGKAFGPQYAAELKKQAGAKPDKILRRKHQIGSLYYDAKTRELELMENRAKGMKSRAETQGKYGWV